MASRPQHIWHPFTQMARFDAEPTLVIERASGNRLIASDGREYIDGVASLWANVHGHGRPEIVAAIRRQTETLQHSTLLGLSHPSAVDLAERLVRHLPAGLTWVFYSENGASAVEVALKMAVQYWANQGRPARQRIVAMEMAYHGDTTGAVSVGGAGRFRDPYAPLLFDPLRFPNPYTYRCRECAEEEGCTLACIEPLRTLLAERSDEVAAVIIEPRVQGAAGMIVAPEGHVAAVRRLCDEHGVLLIADEVATGFGKTGAMFACDLEGVTPDIMVLGKGLSGGYLPLAATVASDAVYQAFYEQTRSAYGRSHPLPWTHLRGQPDLLRGRPGEPGDLRAGARTGAGAGAGRAAGIALGGAAGRSPARGRDQAAGTDGRRGTSAGPGVARAVRARAGCWVAGLPRRPRPRRHPAAPRRRNRYHAAAIDRRGRDRADLRGCRLWDRAAPTLGVRI